MTRYGKKIAFLLLAGNPLVAFSDNENWLKDVSSLLKNNEADKAMSILEPEMENHAGELEYDFILGQAALANNQPNLAIFALERAILSNPTQDGVRYTLARAYAELGEIKQAKKELRYIVKTSDNPHYKKISSNLANKLQEPSKAKYSFIVKSGVGNDSNANSATENESFLGIILSKNSKATSSSTFMGQMTAGLSYPLSRRINFNANADTFKLDYQDASFVNTSATSVGTGLSFKTNNNNQEKLQAFARYVKVNDKKNSQQVGAQFTHKLSLNQNNIISASLRGAQTKYAKDFSVKDVNQISGGLQFQHRKRTKLKDFIGTSVTAITGKDLPLEPDSEYERTYIGAQAGLFISDHRGKVNLITNLNYINSSYNKNFFGKERTENSIGSTVKVDIKLHSKWKISPNISYTRNFSSIDLYDFERVQMNVALSYKII